MVALVAVVQLDLMLVGMVAEVVMTLAQLLELADFQAAQPMVRTLVLTDVVVVVVQVRQVLLAYQLVAAKAEMDYIFPYLEKVLAMVEAVAAVITLKIID